MTKAKTLRLGSIHIPFLEPVLPMATTTQAARDKHLNRLAKIDPKNRSITINLTDAQYRCLESLSIQRNTSVSNLTRLALAKVYGMPLAGHERITDRHREYIMRQLTKGLSPDKIALGFNGQNISAQDILTYMQRNRLEAPEPEIEPYEPSQEDLI